jgi:hypothetical protein
MLLLRWDPTNAAACSRTLPRSPTPESDAAAGMRWPRCWPSRSPPYWPAPSPWPPHPALPAGHPAVARHPSPGPPPRPRPPPRGTPPPAGHHRGWPGLPPRHPGPAGHPPGPVLARPALAHRDGVRGHQPHRGPGPPRPPGRLDPGSLGYRGVAPHPRHHLRRGRLPDPHRQHTTGHGPACATSPRHPAPARLAQPRRRAGPQRPRRHPSPATAWHHLPIKRHISTLAAARSGGSSTTTRPRRAWVASMWP